MSRRTGSLHGGTRKACASNCSASNRSHQSFSLIGSTTRSAIRPASSMNILAAMEESSAIADATSVTQFWGGAQVAAPGHTSKRFRDTIKGKRAAVSPVVAALESNLRTVADVRRLAGDVEAVCR